MLQQVMTNPGEIIFREVPVPEIKDDQVLVKIMNIGICGSDIHVYHGKHPFTKYPVTQGHEVSGEIVKVGKDTSGFHTGQKVTIEPQVYCGHCYPCRHGKYNLCEELKVMGFQTTGTASEYFAVDASKVTPIPEEMSYEEGAMIEPLAVAVHAVKQMGDVKGMNIAVLGAGPIGNLVAQSAKGMGAANVMITDVSDLRLDKAKECGIDVCVNTKEKDFGEAMIEAFGPDKADVIYDCAGNNITMGQAIKYARKGSVIVLVAVFAGMASIDLAVANDHELDIKSTMMYRHDDYIDGITLVNDGKVHLRPLNSSNILIGEKNMGNESNNGKVPLISKIAYGFGDVGCNFSWMFVSNFLMIFYTDVFGISMAAVSALMLFSRFWDAINDPIVGGLTDKTHTRWGRYRPWLLIAAPITAILLVLSFWAHPDWSNTAKIIYMVITYCLLVLGYTCVNIPYGTLCGAMTQDIDERAKINTSRSVSAMIAIGIINIVTVPLISKLGSSSAKNGYLFVAIIYGCIFAACHFFCFAKTKEQVVIPEKERISIKVQLKAVMQNKPYLLALVGQVLFGFTLYGRNADILYYFTYVEGNASYYTTYSMCIIIPSIIGAACFQPVFRKLNNKGRTASIFALFTGIAMLAMYFFNVKESPVVFYTLAGITQFFFSGFNTAIYAIIPDCVEYGEWKTGLRNDGFQYAFVSLGNKIGMAVGTALLAALLGKYGYAANQTQNSAVIAIMKHAFSTIPGILWIVTAIVLFFYRLNKKRYNEIVEDLKRGKTTDLRNVQRI